jgi:hypothetical protein
MIGPRACRAVEDPGVLPGLISGMLAATGRHTGKSGVNPAQDHLISRLVTARESDARVLAVFLGGSHATGMADEHSDLDLYLIVSDPDYEEFFGDRFRFLARLGTPILAEDFNGFGFDMIVFLMEDGVEGELSLGKASGFLHIHGGPHRVLLDESAILSEIAFPLNRPTRSEQLDVTKRNIVWFWRELSLFGMAVARGRLWTAYGYLGPARVRQLDLMRAQSDFNHWPAGYEKVEDVVPAATLSRLARTVTPLAKHDLLSAARLLITLYREVASDLCQRLSLQYPARVDELVAARLDRLGQ